MRRPVPLPARSCFPPKTPWLGEKRPRKTILVRTETKPDDVHGMYCRRGILTAKGGATSHAAVVRARNGQSRASPAATSFTSIGRK